MRVLVLNCGSSSLRADVLDADTGTRVTTARVERLGPDAGVTLGDEEPTASPTPDHAAAISAVLPHLLAVGGIDAVGHRVVHGGTRFTEPVAIDDTVVEALQALVPLAPLHLPANLAAIAAARSALPELPHIAVFDTAFHATLPPRAQRYALPHALAERAGIRRFGFHGPSHAYVAGLAAAHLRQDLRQLRVITCHLGNGASVCAVEYGRSVETSMGMTPLEGLVMGTRAGDIDAGVVLHLLRSGEVDADGLDDLLNRKSGLAGLSGTSGDMRDIETRAAEGHDPSRRAIQVFTHRLRKYLGAYAAVMGGVDAIVFTGGIGQNSALVRQRTLQRLDFLGALLDDDRNRDASVSREAPVAAVHDQTSRVALLVAATDEAHAIARDVAEVVSDALALPDPGSIPIAVSARHVHLTQDMVERLFGPGHTLTPRNPLSQPGQFACEETVDLVGPKRTIERVRVLGPTRPRNQVEISRTDEFFLGVDAPVRRSGDVDNSPGITLRGPVGTVALPEGLICAWRHIHMTPADADRFGVSHGDIVDVAVDGGPRDLVFGDVMVRVKDTYALEMHIDTDEANAAELSSGTPGMLVRTTGNAHLTRLSPRRGRPSPS